MKLRLLPALFVFLLPVSLLFGASAGGRDLKREAELEAEVARLDPAMVEPFRAARIAMDQEDLPAAEKSLRVVVERLPAYDAALRRLGAVLAGQGKQTEGLAFAEQAVVAKRSAFNLGSLARILAFPKNGKSTEAQQDRALALLRDCRPLPDGRDADVLSMTAQLALQRNRDAEAREAVAELERAHPGLMPTHYFSAVIAAMDEHWMKAAREIRAAEKLGLSHETVEQFLGSGIGTRATAWSFATYTGYAVAAWAVGLVALFLLGAYLSRTTLRHAESADVTQAVNPAEQRLRRFYRTVLNVAGVYYYVSLPIVFLLVVAVCGGVILAFFAVGWVPIKLTAIIAIGGLVTIFTMGRSLFLKVNSEDPGRPLERSEAEGLWQLTDEVARTMNTRPIDEIRITVGTDLAVYERGTWREKLENKAQRVLILGAAVLDNFKQDDFRSVLAHEYGHFSHRDTAGGDVAMRVQNDMMKFYLTMCEAGQATMLNIAFHFLRMYHFLFRRISHGATRLQEILADRVAAQTYGPAAFEGGLRHVIAQSIAFGHRADQEIQAAIKANRPIQNLYESTPTPSTTVEEEYAKAINRPTTEDDTHPGPLDRFRLIAKIPAPARPPADGLVWDLFKDRDAIVKEMMTKVEGNVARHRTGA